jgi:hypothetical protein
MIELHDNIRPGIFEIVKMSDIIIDISKTTKSEDTPVATAADEAEVTATFSTFKTFKKALNLLECEDFSSMSATSVSMLKELEKLLNDKLNTTIKNEDVKQLRISQKKYSEHIWTMIRKKLNTHDWTKDSIVQIDANSHSDSNRISAYLNSIGYSAKTSNSGSYSRVYASMKLINPNEP